MESFESRGDVRGRLFGPTRVLLCVRVREHFASSDRSLDTLDDRLLGDMDRLLLLGQPCQIRRIHLGLIKTSVLTAIFFDINCKLLYLRK